MRLFIAIEISDPMRRELAALSKELKARSCGGRFVPPENFHITLRFLGETEDLAGPSSAMHEACRGIRPFTLRAERYGFFDKTGNSSRVGLAEIGGDLGELNLLHETLSAALSDRGFVRDPKRFVPHITLGRNVEHDELVSEELRAIPLSSVTEVRGLTLFESTRVKGKQVYTPLHRERF